MNVMLLSLAVWSCGALICLAARRGAALLGPLFVVGGAMPLLVQSLQVLFSGQSVVLWMPWQVPFGSFCVGMDALSAVFSAPLLIVSALSAVYGSGYLRKAPPAALGFHWFCFLLLTMSMWLVLAARNAVLFLVAWEGMALSSFFLVLFDGRERHVRHAGWLYLTAGHLGAACLIAFFALLGRGSGSMDFAAWDTAGWAPGVRHATFLLALAGFGVKAGLVPWHVWLPEAHPAAPSHVSAVMSGVMIKTGIYGLLRALEILAVPAVWWSWLLMGVGLFSGLLGVLLAGMQADTKRVLAYSSVENVGLITLAVGLGLLARHCGQPVIAALAFTAALWHAFNHALFKSLLFLVAGAVAQATRLRTMDRLGGLLRRMPITGAAGLIGATAIVGLPPLNGFVGEYLLLAAAMRSVTIGAGMPVLAGLAVLGGLALIGGIAAVCFARFFGIVFLGEARSSEAVAANDPPVPMRWPIATLALLCLGMAAIAPAFAGRLANVLPGGAWLGGVEKAIWHVWAFLLGGSALAGGMVVWSAMHGRPVVRPATWGCGYAAPTPRMQYTAASFFEPLSRFFEDLLPVRKKEVLPAGLFPHRAAWRARVTDVVMARLYQPLAKWLDWILAKPRRLQHGRLHLYLLGIVLALFALMIWKLE